MGAVVSAFESSKATEAGHCSLEELFRTLKSIGDAKYADRSEDIIVDKGRAWPDPRIMETMEKVLGEPVKIIATVRPIAECIASFYTVNEYKGTSINNWIKTSPLMIYLLEAYNDLAAGYAAYPENFCLIEYENLCNNTQQELDRVSDFIGVERFTFRPEIEQVNENDNAWGIKNLHTLGDTIKQTGEDTREILGDKLFNLYQGGEFWNDKPEPETGGQPIDLSLECALRGDIDKAYRMLKEIERDDPEDNRVAFNLGWHEMQRGNLLAGSRLLDRGREENIFGSGPIQTDKPIWNGEKNCTVLMEMEAGFGDQFYSIRYAKEIASYGNKVVVGGSPLMAPVLIDVEGVSAITRHEGSPLMHFDYWVPALSAGLSLKHEYSDVKGTPYIKRTAQSEGKIGVRWSGNPEFEHQQHRIFNSELMFNLVKGQQCISLQRYEEVAEGQVSAPKWMETPSLDTWQDTQRAISRCDLVITSCTSVAHLAGAMGVETWIVVPILPYYLWALPGNKTPYYNSVTLFRQEKYGCWEAPFKKLKEQLQLRQNNINAFLYNDISEDNQKFIEM